MTNFPIIGLFIIDVMTSSTGGEHRVRLWLDSRPSPKVENSMSKLVKFLAAASVFAAVSGAAHADTLTYKADSIELEMKKGEFRFDNRRSEQMLTIMNHSAVPLSTVTIECGFFHDDLLIGRDMTMVGSLQSGQDAYVKMTAYVISATRTDCRFGSVSR